jgi:hypothetical protein
MSNETRYDVDLFGGTTAKNFAMSILTGYSDPPVEPIEIIAEQDLSPIYEADKDETKAPYSKMTLVRDPNGDFFMILEFKISETLKPTVALKAFDNQMVIDELKELGVEL